MHAVHTPHPAPATPPVPGRRPDDDSIAGEEDPGASLEELPKATPVPPSPTPPKESPAR